MRIQEEAPLPLTPLATFDEDYEMAIVHLAWDRRGREERTLLFAFVELIPTEIPPPVDDYDAKDPRFSQRLGGQSDHVVYVRHAVVPAREALGWYLGCRRGLAVLPGKDGRLPAPEAAGATVLRLSDLGEEPAWPTLVCAADDSDAIPFAPDWAECPRTHHLLPLAEINLGGLWSKPEMERAERWLSDHLHFSLEEYPEYWGSVHLVAPNPVYRELHTRLQPRTPPAESVLVRFEPRAGKRVEGLSLAFRGGDSAGKLYAYNVPVHSALMRMNFPGGAHAVQKDVIDPVRGMLRSSNRMSAFVTSIKIDMHVASTVEVQGPTPETTYTVMRSGPAERLGTGKTPKLASAEMRMGEAHARRRKRAAARRQNQRWFRGEQEEAVDVLRGLIHEARREVLLVDPYFGGVELVKFMLAVGREDIPVRVLSSAEVLKEVRALEGASREAGEHLLDVLSQLRSHQRMNPFEIKVLTGKRPAVHDRFLVVDERIWLLGSSLNEFGSRGTMMVSLPDPDPVREQLTKAWNDAVELEAWVERRKKNSGVEGGQGA